MKKTAEVEHSTIIIDLTFSGMIDDICSLTLDERKQFKSSIDKLKQMTWQQLLSHKGFHWEQINQKTADGKNIATIRINQKIRARVSRRENTMQFISLHVDHDSAY